MEDAYSVNSPRRTLSYSKRRNRRSVSNESNVFSSSGEFGPKTSEVYGFVGSITTVVATVILLVWAYVPESWLHSVGIFYYPNRQWALIVPSYAMVTIALALAFYIGLNFMSTPPPTSLNIIFDEYSREPTRFVPQNEGDEPPIEPISDISTSKINELMFANEK